MTRVEVACIVQLSVMIPGKYTLGGGGGYPVSICACTCTCIFNPRHVCTTRVTVVVLCVCVCVCVCLSVIPYTILVVCAITSKTTDAIVLSVEFEAIVKGVFSKHVWFETFTYLSGDGHFVLTCNIRAMFRILSITCSLTCYARASLSYGDKGHLYN